MPDPSPDTHVFVGMFRPPFEQLFTDSEPKDEPRAMATEPYDPFRPPPISKWELWYNRREAIRHSWLGGAFDTPVYKTIEEVVRMREG